jgi:tRNA A37 threonylcarbamoyladenosine synthetase subunit TsaC/SUA5/YrdC
VTAAGRPYSTSIYSTDAWIPLSQAARRLSNVAPGPYTFVVDGGASKPVAVTEGGVSTVELP